MNTIIKIRLSIAQWLLDYCQKILHDAQYQAHCAQRAVVATAARQKRRDDAEYRAAWMEMIKS